MADTFIGDKLSTPAPSFPPGLRTNLSLFMQFNTMQCVTLNQYLFKKINKNILADTAVTRITWNESNISYLPRPRLGTC